MSKTTSAPKKGAAKKAAVKTDAKAEIFQEIRSVMLSFVPPLTVIKDTEKVFELVSNKSMVFMGKKRDNVYFGAVRVQGGFVGFYLMSIYAHPTLVQKLGPDLKKLLKGKSCFHIKKITPELLDQIKEAMETGIEGYRKLKFI
jgi:hypothetical protein